MTSPHDVVTRVRRENHPIVAESVAVSVGPPTARPDRAAHRSNRLQLRDDVLACLGLGRVSWVV